VHSFLILLLTLVWFAPLEHPALAQGANRERIQQMLNEATACLGQENCFLGVSRINEACQMLRSNPAAMPEANYIAIAAKTVDDVNAKIKQAQARGDVPSITRNVYAIQPLVTSLVGWEPRNPRWHYEKGLEFRALSATLNDKFPVHLQSAIQEFKQALAISGGGQYKQSAQQMLSTCEGIVRRRNAEIPEFQRIHGKHNQNNQARPSAVANEICVFCGREHPKGFSCPYCGH
jgi:hypothetical protein